MIVGNDISHWQGDIDWDTYTHNSNFVVIKASEGNGFTDPKFTRNQSEARRVNLCLGYYHFARPDLNNSPDVEAEWFLKVVNEIRLGEFLCLDYEANWSGNVVAWCNEFLDVIYRKTTIKPFIYLNQSLAKSHDWTPVVNGGYALWIAAYTGSPLINNFATGKWPSAAMQQWTNAQTVPGIAGGIDGDCFFGDIATLKKYGYQEPVPIPAPEPPQPPAPEPPSEPIVPPYNCDELKKELDQLKLHQNAAIKQAVSTAISENDAKWQTKLGVLNNTIGQLQSSLSQSTSYGQLLSIMWKKLTG